MTECLAALLNTWRQQSSVIIICGKTDLYLNILYSTMLSHEGKYIFLHLEKLYLIWQYLRYYSKIRSIKYMMVGREEIVVATRAILGLQKEPNKARRKFKCYQPVCLNDINYITLYHIILYMHLFFSF